MHDCTVVCKCINTFRNILNQSLQCCTFMHNLYIYIINMYNYVCLNAFGICVQMIQLDLSGAERVRGCEARELELQTSVNP